MTLPRPVWIQALANLASLALALYLGWKPELILFLFWVENIVIGLWQIPRLILADGGRHPGLAGGLTLAGFFSVHYGLFTLVHGAFLFQLFLHRPYDLENVTILISTTPGLQLALLGLFISHGFDFFTDLASGQVRSRERDKQMMEPYGRIVILHLVLLASGFLLVKLPYPMVGVMLLVLIKIVLDIHQQKRKKEDMQTHGP